MGVKDSGSDRVLVVIPTLNEAKNIPDIMYRLKSVGCQNVLIIDGHSKDGTIESAKMLGAQIIIQNGIGKGDALRQAFREGSLEFDIIVIMDADGSMAPEEISSFTNAIRVGADIVKGSRFLNNGGSEDLTLTRRVGNKILTGILNFLFLTNFTDLCYGFMAFRKEALAKLSPCLRSEKFEIETEICMQSKMLGLKTVEIPSFERARQNGESNLRTFKDGFSILRLLLEGYLGRENSVFGRRDKNNRRS